MLESLLLSGILSIDVFAAGAAYGAGGISIPRSSCLVVGGVSAGVLAAAMLLGRILAPTLPEWLCPLLSFMIMLLIGIAKLLHGLIQTWVQRLGDRQIGFRLSGFQFILQVYADPMMADADRSQRLSPREALPLAIATSADALTVGLGAGLGNAGILWAFLFSLCFTCLFLLAGSKIGSRLAGLTRFNFEWLSGMIFIILAITRLL